MAEHNVRKNNIIYIIPNDELYWKLKNGEAFIDDYGRLMNRKPHRVLKELKHYVKNAPMVQQSSVAPPDAPVRNNSTVINHLKETIRDRATETIKDLVDYAVDKLVFEVFPNVWHEHIVPLYHRTKEVFSSKELKAHSVLAQVKTSTEATSKLKVNTKMTQEEVDAEKRRVLYHWIGMLNSLKRLHDAGEINGLDSTMAQLTDPAMLKRVNGFLSGNPNLLETDKYIMLHDLLERDLYKGKQLIPIRAAEITTIATTYGYNARTKKTEENYDG